MQLLQAPHERQVHRVGGHLGAHLVGHELALGAERVDDERQRRVGHVVLPTGARQHGRGIGQAMTVEQLTGTEQEEAGHHFPGEADRSFLPGLRSPTANEAQGDLGDPTSKDKGMYAPDHWSGMAKRRWAMTISPLSLMIRPPLAIVADTLS